MRLSVLVDNNTLTDRYFLGEPGLSFLLEADGKKILFDAGYSDAFLRNAQSLGLDMLHLDWLVLSHGHSDHSWGLDALIRLHAEAVVEQRSQRRPTLVAHPAALEPRSLPGLGRIGSLLGRDRLGEHFPLALGAEPRRLTESVWFLGEIPRRFDFESTPPMGVRESASGPTPDDLPDDTGLAVRTPGGLAVVTGCAHAGVCNTVERAREVCGETNVRGVIGGMHLLGAPERRLSRTAEYLESLKLEFLAPCHCTDLAAKIALAHKLALTEVGAGLQITLS
ncbi:MAG: 7,8-dihydropterin-6-yl-methyl-4-(beta-D-ribofuranosyl)aminobenzene 5-phosphate synthase [Desulfovibrionales bacterium]|nr:7,8-dihydropterin-6-yl-methyl-4-(beta-D-ribofuranosyl)aminobenzene 5-phosphate synthase [Desulfovibrionales bacterium]